MSNQATKTIMMVRPKHFGFDIESALSNPFQTKEGSEEKKEIQRLALTEFDAAVNKMRAFDIAVVIIEDTEQPIKPNALFPNNWISFHDHLAVLYPMMAVNRRKERRLGILNQLKDKGYVIDQVKDMSPSEDEGRFLEGTGSIIFDYDNKLAYACLSIRTDNGLLNKLCNLIGYKAITFDALDKEKIPIYHTNVMMCLAEEYVVICLESIPVEQRNVVSKTLLNTGHEIVDITFDQMYSFAGNMFEVENGDGKSVLVMSDTALKSLNKGQKGVLSKHSELLSVRIPTIEKYGGGSIRCMMCRLN